MKRTPRILKTSILGCALFFLFFCGPAFCASNSTKTEASPELQLINAGADSIPFELEELGGNKISLDSYLGKKSVLVVFWSFFCGPCREEVPLLDEIAKEFAPKDLEMLAVNLDGKKLEKAVQKYVSENKFTFRVLWEEMQGSSYKTADAYGVNGTPSMVLIGLDGKISWSHIGKEDPGVIKSHIEKSLAIHALAPAGGETGMDRIVKYSGEAVKN